MRWIRASKTDRQAWQAPARAFSHFLQVFRRLHRMTSRYFTLMAACMPPALALALTACASHPPAAPAAPPAEQAVMPAAKPAPAAEPAPAAAPTPPAAPAPAPLKLAAFHPNTPAAPHPPMPMGSQGRAVRLYIQAHDLNADQSVSPDEAERARHERFSQADTNQDGAVDLPEYLADSDARMTERLEIEQAQAAEPIAKRFEALSQGQSHISRARFDQAGERIWSAYSSAKLPEALPPAREKQHALAMPSTHSKAGLLALYDRNQDGKLTREEFKQGRETQFARADINRDARLSRAEYETDFRLCAQEAHLPVQSARQPPSPHAFWRTGYQSQRPHRLGRIPRQQPASLSPRRP